MERDSVRQTVTSQFYQTLSESGVEITAIPQSQLQAIVNALADGFFAAFEAMADTLASRLVDVLPEKRFGQFYIHDAYRFLYASDLADKGQPFPLWLT